ncbi:putative bifunctional diguanylate cyclase/phosphodiesterase [Kushneria indalinina]|uniref:cyclic-guanylate-specific phosphodiesterase n=1 Tax=Kushneria indalinina DSM 14324 TaxID=1122140 RepID=A0A3D9DYH1_9GAMM|nr:EAL domain-containing protein [Kushneria indalinina]REC95818.1 diguanylate cyclase/phosphodiesterase [Kushneria indalinina DSM 14324]
MSFRARLLLVMLAVLVVAQLGTAVATLDTIRRDVLHKGSRELDVALDVTRQLLAERGHHLRDNVAVLASDFGFRAAVATQDTGTLNSVLLNHGERAGADMVLLTDPQGRILASSHQVVGSAIPFDAMWQQAGNADSAVGVVLQDSVPYQMVLMPVRAPGLIGWVGMGFMLDDRLAHELGALTRLSVSFMVDDGALEGGGPAFVTGALQAAPELVLDTFREALMQGRFIDHSGMEEMTDTLSRAMQLQRDDQGRTWVIIQHGRDDLLAVYHALSWQLLSIFGVMLVLTAIVAALIARSMTRPLLQLVASARRIGRGERVSALSHGRHREIGLLANTLMGMQTDIDQREQRLLHQSRHDRLTGLSNRDSAQQDIVRSIEQGAPFTLLRLSIVGFRQINDTFGYNVGDEVLRMLAQRLETLSLPCQRAYRLGGDEFLLMLQGENIVPQWITTLHEDLARPVEHERSPIALTLVAGEVSSPAHGESVGLLLRCAEIAMDRARHERTRHVRYEPGQDEQHQRRLMLARDLGAAVEQDQLTMVYQPKVMAASGEVMGLEALMRWQHPTFGFVPPDEFIALAEQSGRITLLTQWMLRTVCRQIDQWAQQGEPLCVAVNLSAHDVMDATLPERIHLLLQDYQLGPERLRLEVTESALIQDPTLAQGNLIALREAGLHIAVDDYGTGYSSLAQLKRLPVQELKIDKSFILKLDNDQEDRIIVHSTIELAHNLGLSVVAEGVETEASRLLLMSMGCDVLQGYLISRPLPLAQVIDWIRQYREGGTTPRRALG